MIFISVGCVALVFSPVTPFTALFNMSSAGLILGELSSPVKEKAAAAAIIGSCMLRLSAWSRYHVGFIVSPAHTTVLVYT